MESAGITRDPTQDDQIATHLEDAAWLAVGWQQFEAAYSADDSIYEQLVDDAPAR
jgi:hypothetical protein